MPDGIDHDQCGRDLVAALTSKDEGALRRVFAEDVDFRAMTPGRFWEASSIPDLAAVLAVWFDADDDIREVDAVETGLVGDRGRVSYRAHVTNPGGNHVLEQTAYFDVDPGSGLVSLARVACSGFRPA